MRVTGQDMICQPKENDTNLNVGRLTLICLPMPQAARKLVYLFQLATGERPEGCADTVKMKLGT